MPGEAATGGSGLAGAQFDVHREARVVDGLESVPHVTLALGGGRAATPTGAVADPALVAGTRGEAATDIGMAGSHVVIDVQIAVDLGASIQQVAAAIRDRIARHIAEQTGFVTTQVDVTVVDVRPPPGRTRTPDADGR